MPSARELLLQADALMRSNRSVGSEPGSEAIPVLTDVAVPAMADSVPGSGHDEVPVLTEVVRTAPEPALPDEELDNATIQYVNPSALRDTSVFGSSRLPPTTVRAPLPEEEPFEPMIDPALLDGGPAEPFMRREARAQTPASTEPSPFRPAPESSLELRSSLVPSRATDKPSTERPVVMEHIPDFPPSEELLAPLLPPEPAPAAPPAMPAPPPSYAAPSPADIAPSPPAPSAPPPLPEAPSMATMQPEPAPAAAPAGPSAAELAEAVYFQVLQNLDLHTERALQRELTVHLAPIIERANRELMTTLHANLGALMRQFIADAIEKQLGVRPGQGERS